MGGQNVGRSDRINFHFKAYRTRTRVQLRREIKEAEAAMSGVQTGDERFPGLADAIGARDAALGVLTGSAPPEVIILGQIGYREGQARTDYYTGVDRTNVVVQEDAYMLLVPGVEDPLVPNFPIDTPQSSNQQVQ